MYTIHNIPPGVNYFELEVAGLVCGKLLAMGLIPQDLKKREDGAFRFELGTPEFAGRLISGGVASYTIEGEAVELDFLYRGRPSGEVRGTVTYRLVNLNADIAGAEPERALIEEREYKAVARTALLQAQRDAGGSNACPACLRRMEADPERVLCARCDSIYPPIEYYKKKSQGRRRRR